MSVKPIFFALDGKSLSEFEFELKILKDHIYGVKVGLELFVSEGPSVCLLYTSPSPRDLSTSRMPSSA